MIVTEAVERYLSQLRPAPDPVLAEMEAHAARDGIPVVTPPTGELLRVVAAAMGVRRVVEIGTAIGVSTLYLARALGPDDTLVSFEIDAARLDAARGYLVRANVLDRCDLRLQDARAGLAQLEGPFDLAFIDAAKLEYGDYLAGVLPLVRAGGLIAVDNALMSGSVAEGRPVGPWREESIVAAREFNERLVSHPELTAATVTAVGDGVALAVRR